jgi:hypothetical protein
LVIRHPTLCVRHVCLHYNFNTPAGRRFRENIRRFIFFDRAIVGTS